jgi:hypothetical protein
MGGVLWQTMFLSVGQGESENGTDSATKNQHALARYADCLGGAFAGAVACSGIRLCAAKQGEL